MYWYLTDHLGSIRLLTDNTGTVIDQIDYDAYGNITNETNAANGDRYKYASGQDNAILGMTFYGEKGKGRWYNPATGSWSNADPTGLAAGPNPYDYVANNPTNATDPSGLDSFGTSPGSYGLTDFYYTRTHWFSDNETITLGQVVEIKGQAFIQCRGYRVPQGEVEDYIRGNFDKWWHNYDNQLAWFKANSRAIRSTGNALLDIAPQPGQGPNVVDQLMNLNGGPPMMAGAGPRFGNVLGEGVGKELKACFGAGTLLYTPQGYRAIESFRVGDLVLSRAEEDATSEISAKRVEEVFVHTGRIWILKVNGREIRTTGEHPFWVHNLGWVNASALAEGNRLLSHDGQSVVVESIEDTNRYETVYNIRVADYHTYFVGCDEWGFNVWAHNQCAYRAMSPAEFALASQGIWRDSTTTDNKGEKWFWDSEVAAVGWRRWLRDEAAKVPAGMQQAAKQDAHLSSQIIGAVNFDQPLNVVARQVVPHTLPGVPGGAASAYSVPIPKLQGKPAVLITRFATAADPP